MYVNRLELGHFFTTGPIRQHHLSRLALERFRGYRRTFHHRTDHCLLVGSLFGILRTVPNRFFSGIGTLYVELFRNVPLIVQFFTWYLVVPELLPEDLGMWFKAELDPNIQFFVSSMLCLGLFTAARVCEQVRAAIQSLPRGQKNAALAMGLTLPQAYRYVLLPNAYRVIVRR